MGPFHLPTNVAVPLEWAHFTYLQMLPVASNGPIATAYEHCRWH